MICVYRTADGEAVSFATVAPPTLPAGLAAVDVGDITGKTWNPATRAMIPTQPPPPDPKVAAIAAATTLADLKEAMG